MENGEMMARWIANANCKLADVPSGKTFAAQPHSASFYEHTAERGNDFNDLFVGNQTEVWNPYLKIRCNLYNADNDFDWAVNPFSTGLILGPQGTDCSGTGIRADNEFQDGSNNHIWNWAQPFKYVYSTGTSHNPNPTINSILPLQCIDDPDACTEFIGIGGPEGIVIADELEKKIELDVILADLDAEYDDVEGDLDNGQKSTLLSNIANSGYSDATLTSELVANSLLSDEVLTAACNRTSFSSQQKIDFIVPNCPVSWEVWLEVEDAFAGPVPEDITDAQAESTVRTLAAITSDKNIITSDFANTVNNILYYYADSNRIDSLIWYMEDTLVYKSSHMLLVGTLLDLDSIDHARTLLESITLEDANDDAFYDFYNIAVSLAEDELSWFDMNAGQIDDIEELAATEYDVATNAQAVLSLLFDSAYTRIPEQMPEEKWDGQQDVTPQPQDIPLLSNIDVYPNPFANSFKVNYKLETEAEEIRIEVCDLTGRTILTRKTGRTQSGNLNIDLGECLGMYLIRVFVDDKQVHKEKLICLQRE